MLLIAEGLPAAVDLFGLLLCILTDLIYSLTVTGDLYVDSILLLLFRVAINSCFDALDAKLHIDNLRALSLYPTLTVVISELQYASFIELIELPPVTSVTEDILLA